MKTGIEYARPDTLNEALEFLWENGKETKPLAGGTDVVVDLRDGKLGAKYLMDVSRLDELRGIEMENDGLSIGSGVTISEIHDSVVIGQYAPALQKASFSFAAKQIRNVATIGGNVANASPSADTAPPLVVHETLVVLSDVNGKRRVPIEELFVAPYRNSIRPQELITSFILRPREGVYADFQKIGRRKALAVARMNMALLAGKGMDGRIDFIRIGLGSSTPTPIRVREAEAFLEGRKLDSDAVIEAGRLTAEKMIQLSGRRPSTVYKEKAAQGMLSRMLYPLVSYG